MRGLVVGRRHHPDLDALVLIVSSADISHLLLLLLHCWMSSLGGAFEVTVHKRGNVVLVVGGASSGGSSALVNQFLRLGLTHDGEEVLAHRELHCGSAEMDHCVVVFEHVHFFNVIKRLHAKLLDRCLELLVLLDGCLSVMRGPLLGPPLSTFTTELDLSKPLREPGASLSNLVI